VEIANAEANVVYVMGVMGHFVGDGSQPLHTTMYFNGWMATIRMATRPSPKIHAWIDGGYFRKTGGLKAEALAGKFIRSSAWPTRVSRTACSAMP